MTLTATAVVDRYPTRIDGDPELIDRADPRCGTSPAAGPIDRATAGRAPRQGLLGPPRPAQPGRGRRVPRRAGPARRRPGLARRRARACAPSDGEVRSIYEVHAVSELVAELVRDPRVLDRARQILGSDVYIHQSRIDYLPGFQRQGHLLALALRDLARRGRHAGAARGQRVDPAGRAAGADRRADGDAGLATAPSCPDADRRLRTACPSQRAPDQRWPPRTASSGSPARRARCSCSTRTPCRARRDNITPFPQTNIHVVFSSVENTLFAPFAGGQPRPPFIANRDGTGRYAARADTG